MTLKQIIQAIEEGKTVYWGNYSYTVEKRGNDYVITGHGHTIGLTWADGVTLNGHEKDFFTKD